MHESQIEQILEELRSLQHRYSTPSDASIPSLNGADRAKFKRLVIEAKSLVDAGLGRANDFGVPLIQMQNLSGFGAWNPPTPDELLEAIALVEGGLNQVRRKNVQPVKASGGTTMPLYVAPQRILQLQAIRTAEWDLRKLVRLLQEINLAYANEMHMATVMLVRAVADHISPILGCRTFSEVANNYTAPRSFSDQMKHLEVSMRKVADMHLHQQVRKSEVLPSGAQVDFRPALGRR
ncbi:hypothetical protein [Massilia varians]|uniref:hypothetical protein n=1 Tax=Massilia varians TaxID=457921 RepID=UPI00255368D2|nr:hypothetical protein [Massilia varians]MDK6080610.1 hypothetical protein [Massilia varians]